MSIWCSRPHIGWDSLWRERGGKGQVRSHAVGWSNHYPTTDSKVERAAMIDTAHIAPWCVPGHEDSDGRDDDGEWMVGPWLRLGVTTRKHKDSNPREVLGHIEAHVVMDEDAVRALVDDLTDWLNTPKARP